MRLGLPQTSSPIPGVDKHISRVRITPVPEAMAVRAAMRFQDRGRSKTSLSHYDMGQGGGVFASAGPALSGPPTLGARPSLPVPWGTVPRDNLPAAQSVLVQDFRGMVAGGPVPRKGRSISPTLPALPEHR